MYESDNGIEEMLRRSTADQSLDPGSNGEMSEAAMISIDYLAEHMRRFVDLHPEDADAINRLAIQIARDDAE